MTDYAARYAPVLSRLECLRPAGREWAWDARCPVHGDGRPSLRLWVRPSDGRLCCHCYAGRPECTWQRIAATLGTEAKDWFPVNIYQDYRPRRARTNMAKLVATYDYRDEQGKLLFQVLRYDPKVFYQRRPHPTREGHWVYGLQAGHYLHNGNNEVNWHACSPRAADEASLKAGVIELPECPRELFRLPELLAADPRQPVFVVEGEKDALALVELGFVATCNAMGAGKWKLEYAARLAGRRVVVIPDNDEPGLYHAHRVAGSALAAGAASLRVVPMPPPHKDASDFLAHDAGPKGRKADLVALVKQAPEWTPGQAAPLAREGRGKEVAAHG